MDDAIKIVAFVSAVIACIAAFYFIELPVMEECMRDHSFLYCQKLLNR
jgi:hypothetical protein